MPLSLERLLAPTPLSTFMREHWPGKPFVGHGPLERFGELRSLPALQSVEAVIEAYRPFPNLLQTWFPVQEVHFTQVGRLDEALANYRRSARLQFNNAERLLTGLREYQGALEEQLGVPHGSISCTIIASSRGARSGAHFDSYPGLTLQLAGTKEWLIGPEACPNTLTSHVLGHASASHVAEYHEGSMPDAMPADPVSVTVAPGSVLFMPRGYVHDVISGPETLSIAFDIVPPNWADLVTSAISRRLKQRTAWRAFALGAGVETSADTSSRLRKELGALLEELPGIVREVSRDPEAVLERAWPQVLKGPPKRYRLKPDADVRITDLGAGSFTLRVEQPARGAVELEMTSELLPLSSWLLTRKTSAFSFTQALNAARGALDENVSQLFDALEEAEVVVVLDGRP